MKYMIVIHGLPAVGKTAVARKVLMTIGSRLRTAVIQGDFFAHMLYGCSHQNTDLDIKYKNMDMVMKNFLSEGFSVLIDDYFRREKDVRSIIALAKEQKAELTTFHLLANREVLRQRNRVRDYWDWIEDAKITAYADNLPHSFPEEIRLNNSAETVEVTVNRIIAHLEKCGAYNRQDKIILNKSFHPIQEK